MRVHLTRLISLDEMGADNDIDMPALTNYEEVVVKDNFNTREFKYERKL